MRILSSTGSYRGRFSRFESGRMVFDAPLRDDRFVPLRVGEMIVVRAPVDSGVVTIRADIDSRDPVARQFTVPVPSTYRFEDRRAESRSSANEGRPAAIEGRPAWVVDMSANGACLDTKAIVKPGELVALKLPGASDVRAWVLEALPEAVQGGQGSRVRLRLESPISVS